MSIETINRVSVIIAASNASSQTQPRTVMQLKGKNNLSLATPIYVNDLENQKFLIVDIRDEEDFKAAHIKDSIHLTSAQDVYQYAKSHQDEKILLVCYSGHTASVLGTHLIEAGCKNIYYFDDYFAHFELLGFLG